MRSLLTILFILMNDVYLVPLNAQTLNNSNINNRLEFALNSNNQKELEELFSEKLYKKLLKEKINFLSRFSNTKWIVEKQPKKSSGESIVKVFLKGQRDIGDLTYSLDSNQTLEIELSNGKITNYRILHQSSILKTLKTPLTIDIYIPDFVLTGSRYDVDIIIEEPLQDNFLAGGLLNTNILESNNEISPSINLLPLSSGGIFKSVQAPFKPGQQTIAVLLVHTKGIIAVTKVIRVVPEIKDTSS